MLTFWTKEPPRNASTAQGKSKDDKHTRKSKRMLEASKLPSTLFQAVNVHAWGQPCPTTKGGIKNCIWSISIKDMDTYRMMFMNTKNELPCLSFNVRLKSYVTMENFVCNLQHWILQKFNIILKVGFIKDAPKFTISTYITWAHAWYEDTNSWGLGMHNSHVHPNPQHRISTKNKV